MQVLELILLLLIINAMRLLGVFKDCYILNMFQIIGEELEQDLGSQNHLQIHVIQEKLKSQA